MIRVLSVASEIFPLIKTGGLADVAGALPAALAPFGVEMHSLIPGYPSVLEKLKNPQPILDQEDFFGGSATILRDHVAGLKLFVLDAPHLYGRTGNPYTAPDGAGWQDNPQRFAALSYAGFLLATGTVPDITPDIIHVHDWQAALCPAYLHYGGARTPSVITIHNMAFQGLAPASLLESLRLPPSSFAVEGVEYFGSIGALKAGLQFASRVVTVSPTYAIEICTPEFGMGLDGLLRARAGTLSGIVNGIDTATWDPASDPALPAAYSAKNLSPKKKAKTALQTQLNLKRDLQAPLFGVVSRLSEQKGLDILLDTLSTLTSAGAQLALLGSGDENLQSGFMRAVAENPGQIGVEIGYDEATAHLIQGGADAILVPSRFEPCGLTQLCALRYGSVPVVSRVGGLNDTVIDANLAALSAKSATGVQFAPATPHALRTALMRTLTLYEQPSTWRMLQQNAMRSDVSWTEPGRAYARLYQELATA